MSLSDGSGGKKKAMPGAKPEGRRAVSLAPPAIPVSYSDEKDSGGPLSLGTVGRELGQGIWHSSSANCWDEEKMEVITVLVSRKFCYRLMYCLALRGHFNSLELQEYLEETRPRWSN